MINLAKDYPFNLISDAMRQQTAPDFSVNAGDIVEDARYSIQWEKELFGQLKYYLIHAPVYPTMGNHEQHDYRFWKYFDLPLPENAQKNGRAYYAFNWGDTFFIILDTNGHWYELRDIDAVSNNATYQYTQEAKERLKTALYEEEKNPLKRLRNRFALWRVRKNLDMLSNAPVLRDEIESRLQAWSIRGMMRRAVLTATITDPIREREREREREYKIYLRAPSSGRISILVPMGEERWAAQMRWLEEELKKNQDMRYIFIFNHHPLRYGGINKQICDLLEKYRVTAVFSGHRHIYALHIANGVYYFQAAGQSDTVFSPIIKDEKQKETFVEHREGPHYMVVSVGPEEAAVQCFSLDSELFAEHRISRRPPSVPAMQTTESIN
jgi:3',5'-cyclic AMP phosphodiesterase CpdA